MLGIVVSHFLCPLHQTARLETLWNFRGHVYAGVDGKTNQHTGATFDATVRLLAVAAIEQKDNFRKDAVLRYWGYLCGSDIDFSERYFWSQDAQCIRPGAHSPYSLSQYRLLSV
ncbi:hypothetical protein ES703_106576 [subsurface metagenome]